MSAVLIGMMGAGKTTLGRLAAGRLGGTLLDLDGEIERAAGLSVAEIFAKNGEEEFRRLERDALASIKPRRGLIVSVGGGAPMDPGNWPPMRRAGRVVYLRCPASVLAARVEGSEGQRPLLSEDLQEDLERLLDERSPVYECADVILDVEGRTAEELADVIADIARTAGR
ncbi:MAG: shikimate kinase [Armatimonadetes bacterium]|nr:shikimate kinase [Armatimonadota bacterium]